MEEINYNKVKPGDNVHCKWCGNDFTASHYSQHYCSKGCGRESMSYQQTLRNERNKQVQNECKQCGKIFWWTTQKDYCDYVCANKHKQLHKKRECKMCHNEYTKSEGGFNYYCSSECKSAYQKTKIARSHYSKYRHKRTVRCKYCKKEYETLLLKKIFCSDECKSNWGSMIDLFSKTNNCVYYIGWKINDNHYIKIGIAKTFAERFKRYSTDTPFLMRVYMLKKFNTINDAKEYEKSIHIKTIQNQTESANEWRIFNENDIINLIIDSVSDGLGVVIDTDGQFYKQLT